MTQLRATIYRRVSTEEQREGTSLGAQLDRCTSHYAEQRIMPSRPSKPLWGKGFALLKSA